MSDPLESDVAPKKENPEKLVLRGRPRPVVRLRRGLIVGAAGAMATALVSLSWFALQPAAERRAAPETNDPLPGNAPPEALADAPRNYAQVPRLGPPLPGDLGRPILEHQRSLRSAESDESRRIGADTLREEQERERRALPSADVRRSPLLVPLAQRAGDANSTGVLPASAPAPVPENTGSAGNSATVAGAQQKLEFTRAQAGDVHPVGLHVAASPFTLSAGTVIPASLITGLNSDLPGMVIAQVTENVRDTRSGTIVLVPQGARLIGRYDSLVAYGQRRALLVWDRILFPDGGSVDLDNMPATDASGYAGLRDGVDSHTWQLLKGIGLSTLLGIGTELSLGSSGSDLVRAIRESAQQNAANSGAAIIGRQLDVQPTITIRPGWPVRAILNRDMVLEPWRR